jgi:hypothetical protein
VPQHPSRCSTEHHLPKAKAELATDIRNGWLTVRSIGSWSLHAVLPSLRDVLDAPLRSALTEVQFDCDGLESWDSRFVGFSIRGI